jgi:hypothetical protein
MDSDQEQEYNRSQRPTIGLGLMAEEAEKKRVADEKQDLLNRINTFGSDDRTTIEGERRQRRDALDIMTKSLSPLLARSWDLSQLSTA